MFKTVKCIKKIVMVSLLAYAGFKILKEDKEKNKQKVLANENNTYIEE